MTFYRIDSDSLEYGRLDASTESLMTIDYSHHEVHSGDSFTSGSKLDVAQSANYDILVISPDSDKYAHFTYEIECESETDINVYEGTVVSASALGTAVPIYNRDRNSSKTAGVTVYHAPQVASTGSAIRVWHVGTGGAFSRGGGDRATHEFVLKKNTKYLIRCTNVIANAPNYMSVKLDWYEHLSRN